MFQLALAAALLLPTSAPGLDPISGPGEAISPVVSATEQAADQLFPPAKAALMIDAATDNSGMSVQDLVRRYGELTSQEITYSEETEGHLSRARLRFDRRIEVPIGEVQMVFESLLRQNDFYLHILKADGVRILEVVSLNTAGRNDARSGAHFLAEESLDLASRHPALIFSTVVTLPHTDVRQVSNSMRTMITDANTMQMLPAGNSHSMVIVGFGDSITNIAGSLRIIDDAAAASFEAAKLEYQVLTVKNGDAKDMAALVSRALRLDPEGSSPTQVLADARTNSLVITASRSTMETVKSLVARLDV